MRTFILAAFAALSLAAAVAPMANAAVYHNVPAHSGPYDNTQNSLGGVVLGGGD